MRRPPLHTLAAVLLAAACALGWAPRGRGDAPRGAGAVLAVDHAAPAAHAKPAATIAFGEGRVPARPGTDRPGGTSSPLGVAPGTLPARTLVRPAAARDRYDGRDVRRDPTHFSYFPTAPPSSV